MTPALDTALNAADSALRTLFAKPRASRTCPTLPGQSTELSTQDKALSGALMRINHVGEVCAQDRKSTRLNSSHIQKSRMPSSA